MHAQFHAAEACTGECVCVYVRLRVQAFLRTVAHEHVGCVCLRAHTHVTRDMCVCACVCVCGQMNKPEDPEARGQKRTTGLISSC